MLSFHLRPDLLNSPDPTDGLHSMLFYREKTFARNASWFGHLRPPQRRVHLIGRSWYDTIHMQPDPQQTPKKLSKVK
jgi:hypothetical protein